MSNVNEQLYAACRAMLEAGIVSIDDGLAVFTGNIEEYRNAREKCYDALIAAEAEGRGE